MPNLTELSHVVRPLKNGGSVLVLDTAALIEPETVAMIGARYSRSAKGALTLIEEMFDRNVGKFMRDNYQAGYGHKSIGELGEAAIFIDGVSMLCAKAIQDFPLYRGQESSTRYIDFSKQRFKNPAGSEAGTRILEGWRSFYLEAYEAMIPHLVARFPRQEGENEKVYEKAIRARAFDVVRAFLPAGATTNVAWMGDLRHINDHLLTLRNHPLEEVREVGLTIEDALIEKFPDSFGTKRYDATEEYARAMGRLHSYLRSELPEEFRLERDAVDRRLLTWYASALSSRPPKAELPFAVRECGEMAFLFTLDFGSYRDLQRHRALITPMPCLAGGWGFDPWYLEELPESVRLKAKALEEAHVEPMVSVTSDLLERQYYVPMGMKTQIRMTGDLRALVYFVELRATRFVHPTLRRRARQVGKALLDAFSSYGLVLHLDQEPDRFDVKRGTHDIIAKT